MVGLIEMPGMLTAGPEQALWQGMAELDIAPDAQRVQQLLAYLALLQRWNRAYNLTATSEPGQLVTRHVLDSLAVAPVLRGLPGKCLDVGTGAGLPGIPLAIVYPQREFHLLDSNGKKTRFLFQVKTTLGLDNITIHNQRVEVYTPARPFDVILSRAFASLADMVESCRHLCAEGGRFLAMKGVYPAAELAALTPHYQLAAAHRLQVPGLPEERHLLELSIH